MNKTYKYQCRICGFVYESDEDMPDDYVCPVCGAGKEEFDLLED